MKKLIYRLESKITGEVFTYKTVSELCEANHWIRLLFHTISKLKKNNSYTNKICIITKHYTELVRQVKPQKIFEIKTENGQKVISEHNL